MSNSIYPIITRADAIKQGLKFYFTGKTCKYGHISHRYISGGCVDCVDESHKSNEYKEYQKSDKSKESRKKYAKSDKAVEYNKQRHLSNDYREYQREYQTSVRYKEYCKNYHKSDKVKEYNKEYQKSDKAKEYNKEYRKSDKAKEWKRTYNKIRKASDPLYKLTCDIRSLIGSSMKKRGGFKKSTKTAQILGCSFEEFKKHIENQFTEGMNWDNSGEWHYDHIFPVSRATDEAHLITLNHYTNFQPLWATDNIKKSNKI